MSAFNNSPGGCCCVTKGEYFWGEGNKLSRVSAIEPFPGAAEHRINPAAVVEVANITDGGTEYQCVSVAGTQYADATGGAGGDHAVAWYQLNFAPVSNLGTNFPRAGLAVVKVYDEVNQTPADWDTPEFSLVDAWLIKDDSGSVFYWDDETKLCNYWDDDFSNPRKTCVGTGHFALESRRVSGNNELLFWAVGQETATKKTWSNPETNMTVGGWSPITFSSHCFPLALFARVDNIERWSSNNTWKTIERENAVGLCNLSTLAPTTNSEFYGLASEHAEGVNFVGSRDENETNGSSDSATYVYVNHWEGWGVNRQPQFAGSVEAFELNNGSGGTVQSATAYECTGTYIAKLSGNTPATNNGDTVTATYVDPGDPDDNNWFLFPMWTSDGTNVDVAEYFSEVPTPSAARQTLGNQVSGSVTCPRRVMPMRTNYGANDSTPPQALMAGVFLLNAPKRPDETTDASPYLRNYLAVNAYTGSYDPTGSSSAHVAGPPGDYDALDIRVHAICDNHFRYDRTFDDAGDDSGKGSAMMIFEGLPIADPDPPAGETAELWTNWVWTTVSGENNFRKLQLSPPRGVWHDTSGVAHATALCDTDGSLDNLHPY